MDHRRRAALPPASQRLADPEQRLDHLGITFRANFRTTSSTNPSRRPWAHPVALAGTMSLDLTSARHLDPLLQALVRFVRLPGHEGPLSNQNPLEDSVVITSSLPEPSPSDFGLLATALVPSLPIPRGRHRTSSTPRGPDPGDAARVP